MASPSKQPTEAPLEEVPEGYITVRDAVEQFEISKGTVRKYAYKGMVDSVKVAGKHGPTMFVHAEQTGEKAMKGSSPGRPRGSGALQRASEFRELQDKWLVEVERRAEAEKQVEILQFKLDRQRWFGKVR